MSTQTQHQAHATFMLLDGEEKPAPPGTDGAQVTRARFTVGYEGDLAGRSVLAELHRHLADGSIHIFGKERFTGTLGGRAGSFVLEHDGQFAGGRLVSTRTIVPDSATGALTGLRGAYTFRSGQADVFALVLAYWFE